MRVCLLLMVGFAWVAPASAQPSTTQVADQIVSSVAAHTIEGWADAGLTLSQQEAVIAGGGTVRVACGYQADLAVRALLRAGIPARLVAGKSLSPTMQAKDNGHTLMEAFIGNRWQVYDPTFNEKPVLPNGQGMSIEQLSQRVRARKPIRFVPLAHDQLVDFSGFPAGYSLDLVRGQLESGPLAYYRLFLQQPLVWTSQYGFVYTGSARSYVEARWPGFRWLSPADYATATANSFDQSILSW